jgi:hypothetical protein
MRPQSPIAALDDARIYEHELATLGKYQMVDDSIIHFHCAVLNHLNCRNYSVTPCVVRLLQEFPPPQILDQITPLNLQQCRTVFLPLATKNREHKH